MLQRCLQIKVKYIISLVVSLFLTYWMFGISSNELIPQWHISLPTRRFYPFYIRRVDHENIKLYAVAEDRHFYQYFIYLRKVPRLEPLPELLPMHALALPTDMTKVRSFDVRVINNMRHLILLCQNSSIYALDDNFNLLWESHIFAKSEGYINFVESGFVRFMNTCLSPEKCSVVIVGVSLRRSNSHEAMNGRGRHHEHKNTVGKHLSTVAFDAQTGELLWHHLPFDYGHGLEDEESRLAPPIRQHWKLKLLRSHLRMEHIDERPWVTYLPFFMKLLPYNWVRSHDDTDVFKTNLRHHRVDSLPEQNPGEIQQESSRANVIVVKHEQGLEVLDIFTGKPRSHLEMTGGPGKTYFRDASRLLLATLEAGYNLTAGITCTLRIIPRSTSGPGSSHIHQQWSDVCAPVGIFGTVRPQHINYREDPDKMVPPVIVDRYKSWSSLLKFFGLGYTYRNIKDIITLVSDGSLSSYSSDGQVNWRASLPVSWLHISRDIASGDIQSEDVRDRYKNLFVPSLTRLRPSESLWETDAVIAVGWNSIAITDARTGHLIASHDLPCQPIYRPVVVNDHVVVGCHTMVVGFRMHVAMRFGKFIMVFTAFSCIFTVCVFCLDSKSVFWDLLS